MSRHDFMGFIWARWLVSEWHPHRGRAFCQSPIKTFAGTFPDCAPVHVYIVGIKSRGIVSPASSYFTFIPTLFRRRISTLFLVRPRFRGCWKVWINLKVAADFTFNGYFFAVFSIVFDFNLVSILVSHCVRLFYCDFSLLKIFLNGTDVSLSN